MPNIDKIYFLENLKIKSYLDFPVGNVVLVPDVFQTLQAGQHFQLEFHKGRCMLPKKAFLPFEEVFQLITCISYLGSSHRTFS